MKPDVLAQLLPIVILVAFAYLLIIRPARRRAHAAMALQRSLHVGDRVLLTSGIYAEIVDLDDVAATVEVAPGVHLRVHRQAIAEIQNPEPAAEPTSTATDDATSPDHEGEI